MKSHLFKVIKSIVVGITVLTLSAAPALQAIQLSKVVERMNQVCQCCCCTGESTEHSSDSHSLQKASRCGCEVGQSLPINSAPLVSTDSKINHDEQAAVIQTIPVVTFAVSIESNTIIVLDHIPKKHPPLFVLNTSFLI